MEQLQALLQSLPSGWSGAACGAVLLGIMLAGMRWLTRKQEREDADNKAAVRAAILKARGVAVAEGRLDDAAYLTSRLNALGAVLCVLGCLSLAGCKTTTPEGPVTFGQRAFEVQSGQVVTVPPLMPPATRWFLLDSLAVERLSLRE